MVDYIIKQVKELTGSLDMATNCRHSATWSVQSTPANNAREGVRQYYIYRERKKERYKLFDSLYIGVI